MEVWRYGQYQKRNKAYQVCEKSTEHHQESSYSTSIKQVLESYLQQSCPSDTAHAQIEHWVESIIPARKNRSKGFKTRGKYRREMKSGYDLERYRQRNKVETVNSVIKRKMGDCVRSRNVLNQNREILFMVMVYNIERSMKISLIIVIGFLLSPSHPPCAAIAMLFISLRDARDGRNDF